MRPLYSLGLYSFSISLLYYSKCCTQIGTIITTLIFYWPKSGVSIIYSIEKSERAGELKLGRAPYLEVDAPPVFGQLKAFLKLS